MEGDNEAGRPPPLPTVGTQPFTGFRTSVADGNGVRDANALEEGGQQGAAWSREGGGVRLSWTLGPKFLLFGNVGALRSGGGTDPPPPPAMTPHINIQ